MTERDLGTTLGHPERSQRILDSAQGDTTFKYVIGSSQSAEGMKVEAFNALIKPILTSKMGVLCSYPLL